MIPHTGNDNAHAKGAPLMTNHAEGQKECRKRISFQLSEILFLIFGKGKTRGHIEVMTYEILLQTPS